MMAEPLSPAAQAIVAAMHRSYDHEPTRRLIAAAILRELEDILARDRSKPLPLDLERAVLTERIRLFRRITAIATELENHEH